MQKGLVWFRRDLRLHDHAALASAISSCDEVHCLFVFDPEILSKLEDKSDARVQFIHDSLVEMQNQASIEIRYGDQRK